MAACDTCDTCLYQKQYIHILSIMSHCFVTNMDMVCRIIGHRFRDTYVIRESGDFFEVDDAQYCRFCGTVHPSFRLNQLARTAEGWASA